MKTDKKMLGALALALLPLQAMSAVVIDNSTTGRYNAGLGDLAAIDGPGGFLLGANVSEGDPTLVLGADPNLTFTAAFGADWLGGDYSGGSWSAGPVAIPLGWAVNSETAIVYEFNLAAASSLHIDVGVDNGILVWLNGNFLFGATASGGADINEYNIDVASLAAGSHALQILRADHGGGTGFAILAETTELPPVPTPAPAGLALLGAALLGVGLVRGKRTPR